MVYMNVINLMKIKQGGNKSIQRFYGLIFNRNTGGRFILQTSIHPSNLVQCEHV